MRANLGARHFVYRCFDADGELLYIGATSNLAERMKEYEGRPQVAFWDSDEYPTRAEAFAAERAAIREHQPPWNTQNTMEATA